MRIEYLQDGSADCPLIRIFGTEPADFSLLHESICVLSSSVGQFCAFHELPNFECIFGTQFIGCSSACNAGIVQVKELPRLEWRLTNASWLVVAGFIEPFFRNPEIGTFQWLTGREARWGLDVGKVAVLLSFSGDGHW